MLNVELTKIGTRNKIRKQTSVNAKISGFLPLNEKIVGRAFGFNFFQPSARFCSNAVSSKCPCSAETRDDQVSKIFTKTF